MSAFSDNISLNLCRFFSQLENNPVLIQNLKYVTIFTQVLTLDYIRNFRFIKMSSPRMNNIIVVGAILIYIAGILLGIDGNFVSPSAEAIIRCRVSITGYKTVPLKYAFSSIVFFTRGRSFTGSVVKGCT